MSLSAWSSLARPPGSPTQMSPLTPAVLERLRVGRPRRSARGGIHVVVDDLPAERPHRVSILLRNFLRKREIAGQHADVIGCVRVLLAEIPQVPDLKAGQRVRFGLDEQVRTTRLDARDEAGDIREQALQPGLDAVLIEGRAATHHGEVVLARLGHARDDVGQRGIALVDDDLAAIDPAPFVAPRRKDIRGIEELLVQAGSTGEPDVREGCDPDRVGRDSGRRRT